MPKVAVSSFFRSMKPVIVGLAIAPCACESGAHDARQSGGRTSLAGGTTGTSGEGGLGGSDGGATAEGSAGSVVADFGGSAGAAGSAAVDGRFAGLPKHIVGADITITLEDEYWGATYTDGSAQKPLEQLLKDHGFNYIRIDTFVNPGASDGYAYGKSQNFRDLAHTITLAKRVKAIGMGFLLDLHYSDTWTNPGQQATPMDWAGLDLTALSSQVYSYTKDALSQLSNAGAKPDIVQIGNEITNGMLWDNGRILNSDFKAFAALLKSGSQAVRDFDPAILVMLHIEKCNNLGTTTWWLDGIMGQGVPFDILGQSCYATAPNGVAGYQGTPEQWASVFAQVALQYPQLRFIIAEYSAEQRAAHDTMRNLPDGRGLGAFNWDPTRSYATHPAYPIFTTNGAWNQYVTIPELLAIYDGIATEYGLR